MIEEYINLLIEGGAPIRVFLFYIPIFFILAILVVLILIIKNRKEKK